MTDCCILMISEITFVATFHLQQGKVNEEKRQSDENEKQTVKRK